MYQPPPMPPQRPSAFQAAIANFRRMPPVIRIIVIAFVIIVILACLGVAASAGKNPNTASATATSAPVVQATATQAPKATATPAGPHILTGATLGGLVAAFVADYGASDIGGGPGAAQRYHFFSGSQEGEVLVIPADSSSSDGKLHIASVELFPTKGSWDAATAASLAKLFLPADAKPQPDKQIPDYGTEHVYLSSNLTVTFPASAFTDVSTNQPVSPGTFSVGCGQGWRPDGGCSIILGT